MINVLNRNDDAPIGVAGNYSKMRFWSPDFIINEFDKLVDMGVRTLRISDEMFLLNKKYYVPLCEKLLKEVTVINRACGLIPELTQFEIQNNWS